MSIPIHFEERERDLAERQEPDSQTSVASAIRQSILAQLEDARVEVQGSGGHFTIDVVSVAFVGKNPLERQRLVYRAIAPLMKGDNAPVHAVDRLSTRVSHDAG